MPKSCAVGGCIRNSDRDPSVRFFQFPSDTKICREWVRFVNTTRSNFRVGKWSHICSAHFSDDCQETSSKLMAGFGIPSKFRLKKGAIPSRKSPNIATTWTPRQETQTQSNREKRMNEKDRRQVIEQSLAKDQERDSTSTTPTPSSTVSHGEQAGKSTSSDSVTVFHHSVSSDEEVGQPLKLTGVQTESNVRDQGTQTVRRWRCTINKQRGENIWPKTSSKTTYVRSKRTQTDRKMFKPVNKGIQVRHVQHNKITECSLVKGPQLRLFDYQDTPKAVVETEYPVFVESDSSDLPESESSYEPSSYEISDSDLTSSSDPDAPELNVIDDPKFIVFKSNLLQLFQSCPKCASKTKADLYRPLGGTMAEVLQVCRKRGCCYSWKWRTQPMVGNISAGNILLSSSILISGCSIRKFLRALTSINIASFSYQTFFNHQKWYLQPAISHVWHADQSSTIADLVEQNAKAFLGMDMRADSPGHCAKFGCYSTMDVKLNKVLHIELVQKNECDNKSNLMEKEGLVRTVKWLERNNVTVGTIVTDRHRQIAKFIREKLEPKGIKHYFDVWHVAKGLKKKLLKVSKLSGCDVVRPWIQGISNNLYWVASSTQDGDGDLMLAKFESIIDHVMGIHVHDNPLFPKCAHGPIDERTWLKAGTKPAEEVNNILAGTWLRKDVRLLSPSMQTSSVESFHSVINQFAPKMFVYSFESMLSRIFLAALHYNENAGRRQATTSKGKLMYSIVFPRAKLDTGGYTVRKLLVNCTYDYSRNILQRVIHLCQLGDKTTKKRYSQLSSNPGYLTENVQKPVKSTAVKNFVSRFKNVTPVGRPEEQPGTSDPIPQTKKRNRPEKNRAKGQPPSKRQKTTKQHTKAVKKSMSDSKKTARGDKRKQKASKKTSPKEKAPKRKAPKEKAPNEKAPKEKAPKRKAPQEKAPKEKAPNEKAPKEKSPNEKAPKRKAPKEKAPNEKAPKEKAPKRKAPQEKAPKEKAPNEKAPKEKSPNEKAPKEKAPKEKAPKQKAPKEKAPKEKAPKEKTPKEKTPKEKAPKEKAPNLRS